METKKEAEITKKKTVVMLLPLSMNHMIVLKFGPSVDIVIHVSQKHGTVVFLSIFIMLSVPRWLGVWVRRTGLLDFGNLSLIKWLHISIKKGYQTHHTEIINRAY